MHTQKKMRNCAILHDYIEHTDGGSKLCTILGKALKADLYYGFRSQNHPFFDEPYGPGQEQALMRSVSIPLLRQYLLAKTFSKKAALVEQYTNIIYSGFYSPLAASQTDGESGILYCHTPPRFVYDQRNFYLSTVPSIVRPLLQAFINWYTPQFEFAISRIKTIVTNSENVKSRVKKYLHRNADVIYPPCETTQYSYEPANGYYLSMGRHDPLKRIDIIINAFKKMPHKNLVITSSGPDEASLKKLADGHDNIRFTGPLSESKLRKTIAESIATIYIPKQEDFGMCAVESMAAGKPVIAAREGGLLETVLPDETGVFIPPNPHPEHLIEAVTKLSASRAAQKKTACLKQAKQFDTTTFTENMKQLLHNK